MLLKFLFYNSFRLAYNTWACPTCGNKFDVKWYKLVFAPGVAMEKPKLKCPKCKISDSCSIAR